MAPPMANARRRRGRARVEIGDRLRESRAARRRARPCSGAGSAPPRRRSRRATADRSARPFCCHWRAAVRSCSRNTESSCALLEPAAQRRPGVDQRLVHDLDGGAGAAVAGLHDEQARLDQLVDEPLHLAALARQLGELVERDDGARALGGDQPQEQRARQRTRRRRQLGEHRVGVAGERAGDAAEPLVALDGEQLARADRAPPTASSPRTAAAAAPRRWSRGARACRRRCRGPRSDSRPSPPAARSPRASPRGSAGRGRTAPGSARP